MTAKFLIVSDSTSFCQQFLAYTGEIGIFTQAVSGKEFASTLQHNQFTLVLLDADLSSADAHEQVSLARRLDPACPVLMIANTADRDHAVTAIATGAADYLVQPVSRDIFIRRVQEIIRDPDDEELIAIAPSSRHSLRLAYRAAATSATILITGESGTGKEVFCRFIHRNSPRKDKPFVAVNCAAIPATMLESILFGHEKGAFTGASSRKAGKFEQADGGTLFLDEIAEMPLEQQAKLLRVLQEKEVERLGASQPVKVDVRLLSATNQNLWKLVEQGRFREDLFYRLNVFPLHLAPLRERPEDILPLAKRMIQRYASESDQPEVELSGKAIACLQAHSWPGNIRELENVIQRACVLKRGWVILGSDLMLPEPDDQNGTSSSPMEQQAGHTPDDIVDILDRMPGPARKRQEWRELFKVLCRHKGHRSRSAEELGMTTRMLRYKLAQLREAGLDIDTFIADRSLAC